MLILLLPFAHNLTVRYLFVSAGASPGDKASLLAAAGEKFGWAVPFGRVLVKDKNGRQLWGLLLKIYDGDIDVRLPLLLLS